MPARILVVDNYDSFVYNLVQYLYQLGAECEVVRNDAIGVEAAHDYDGVLLSPGPGTPEEAGICVDMVHYTERHRIPAENLLTPELLRRLAWSPPGTDRDSVAACLAAGGARDWQVQLCAEALATAMAEPA